MTGSHAAARAYAVKTGMHCYHWTDGDNAVCCRCDAHLSDGPGMTCDPGETPTPLWKVLNDD